MTGIPAELDEVLDAALNVLRRYSRTEEVLETIKRHIEYYIENARLVSSLYNKLPASPLLSRFCQLCCFCDVIT